MNRIIAVITILVILVGILVPNIVLATNELSKNNITEETENTIENIEENIVESNSTKNIMEENNIETENQIKQEENSIKENNQIEEENNTKENNQVEEENNNKENTQIKQDENTNIKQKVIYKTHVQDIGWQENVQDGETSGTTKEGKRIEAIQISLGNAEEIPEGASIKYQAHVQDYGWMGWKKDGEIAGTTKEGKRIEAIQIQLQSMDGYSVIYRVHVQDYGWMDWKKNGEIAGTTGEEKRIEAIEIKIVKNPEIKVEYIYNESNNTVTAKINSSKQLKSINDNNWTLSQDKLTYSKEYDINDIYNIVVEDIDGIESNVQINITDVIEPISMVKYSSHIETNGWEKKFSKKDGETSGTTKEGKRIEAIQISLGNAEEILEGASIKYQAHVQDYGWMGWKKDGEIAGTTKEGKRIEAIQIQLQSMDGYSVIYRVHVQDYGWMDWKKNGERAGTTGEEKRIEAIEIKIVKNPEIKVEYIYNESNNTVTAKINSSKQLKSINDDNWTLSQDKLTYSKEYDINDIYNIVVEDIDGIESNVQINITDVIEPISMVKYSSHIDTNGWEKKYSKIDGDISGTTGESKRIEAIQISLGNAEEITEGASIKYQAHVQDYGWMGWKKDGEIAGTVGEGLRIEAIQIQIEGLEGYCVEYRVHLQDTGWQKWKSDGEIAGTTKEGKRIEAIQIRVVRKEDKTIEPSVEYQAYIQKDGWIEKVPENTETGKIGVGKGIKALKLNLKGANSNAFIKYKIYTQDGWEEYTNKDNITEITEKNNNIRKIQIELQNLEEYSIEYKVYISGYGWQKWKKNGEIAGTIGSDIEAIKIRIVYKNTETVEPEVNYQAYIQENGWQEETAEGFLAGTQGQSKRIEALKINLADIVDSSQKIKYRAHVQDIGWQPWVRNGAVAGATGKRIEAIQIELEGLDSYTVEYQVHIQDYGWSEWMIDGETAGTVGEGKRIEAIKIRIVPKYYRQYKGIDVSEHNGLIDWQSVKNSGVQFAMIRCAYRGYGTGKIVTDKYFDYNVKNASAVGIQVGVYFFSQAISIAEAVEEANYTLDLVKKYRGCVTYPIAIDTEYSSAPNNTGRADGLDVALRTNVVAAFCNQINNSGYTPMVYASKNWLYNNLEITRLSLYETWLAHYTNSISNPTDYKYDYTMWQYTSSGSVPGINHLVDLNVGYKKY